MRVWTHELLDAMEGTKRGVLPGFPPARIPTAAIMENLENAFAGIPAGLDGRESANDIGCAVYCEREMTPEKWNVWQSRFLGRGTTTPATPPGAVRQP